ncbi:hypothetical protein [Nocardioides convexus]|uniref:hypothetical protein n=1 Tax=Nocardioides convexus TaxID=2712224 RepID=UPI0024184200|nr:hypothetical protein [Nocardioides convexus]
MNAPAPVILLVSADEIATLTDQFRRYEHDYDVRPATSAAEATAILKQARTLGQPVAMIVTDSLLPDENVLLAMHDWRTLVPTARRIVAIPISRFAEETAALRPYLAKGKFDTYLVLPQGRRDEEFHYAVVESAQRLGRHRRLVGHRHGPHHHARRHAAVAGGARLPGPDRLPAPHLRTRLAAGGGGDRPARRAGGRRGDVPLGAPDVQALRGPADRRAHLGARPVGADVRPALGRRRGHRRRPRGRRRRPGRSRRRRVRRLRGLEHGRARVRGDRRTGRHQTR